MSTPTVDVPAVGRVKKQYVYVGGALVAGIVGYAYWKKQAAPVDIPAYTPSDITDTGITDTSGGAAGASANSGGASHDNSTTPDTDAEWAQQANEALAGSFDSAALATALGKYITHQGLSGTEQDMVRAAIGLLGYPPGGAYPLNTDTSSNPSTFQAPSGLKVDKVTTTEIDLSWGKVTGASGYRIYRSDLGDEPIGDSADTKFSARGLQPNTSYSFTVAARTATGQPGPHSSKVTGKTAAVKFARPATPTVSGITRSSARVSTGKVSGATRYGWYVNGVAHGSSDGPSYTLAGLHPGTHYTVAVAADNGSQAPGPQSGKRSFTTKK